MKVRDIILIGGGGHCRSCIEVIESAGAYHIAGIVDLQDKIGQRILGYEVIAADDALPSLARTYRYCFVTVGQIKSAALRIRLTRAALHFGFTLPVVVSPKAHVSRHATVADGTIVMAGAAVNANAKVGLACIVNTGAILEHDVTVGEYCHVSTGAIVNGGATVGDRCFIGSNATLKENIRIASDTIIAAGAVVIEDCLTSGTYLGIPAVKAP